MLLTASNISFSYGDRPILRDASLDLRAGEVLTLIGPNGSGKSTLIRVLLGQLRSSGQVLWDATPVQAWRRRDLARRIAYLPQAPTYDPGQRVADVLRLGRAPYWLAMGIESAHDCEVILRTARLLELDDLLDRPVDALSGGQRQRVFVGRCLAQEPAALLLDEPKPYLDLRHQVDLCLLLRRLAREQRIAVLMASHDLNLAGAYADRLMLLDSGAVAATGTPDEVLRPELLSRVYGVALRRVDEPGHPPVIVARLT
jgi:iron complex transport system ATP-binding protein